MFKDSNLDFPVLRLALTFRDSWFRAGLGLGTWACQHKVVLLKVTTVKGLGVFWRILFRWKASVYKSVWYNLLLYILLYSSLSITYRYFLSEEQRVLLLYLSNDAMKWILL